MSKKLVIAICLLGALLSGAKCSREHVKSVEAMNSCVEYHHRKLFPQAIRDCNKAISLDPENEKAHHNISIVYTSTEEWDRAAKHLQLAINLNGEVPMYHYQLGRAYEHLSQWERAETAYKKAIELDDSLFKSHYRLGNVYAHMDNPQQAMQKYTDALMKNGKFPDAYRELGTLYMDYGFLSQSEQVLQEGIKALLGRGDELAVLHSRLGSVFAEKKDYDSAVAEFKKAIELKPDMVNVMFNLGWNYAYINVENAKIWLQKFVESAGQDTPPDYVSAAQGRLAEIENGTPIR